LLLVWAIRPHSLFVLCGRARHRYHIWYRIIDGGAKAQQDQATATNDVRARRFELDRQEKEANDTAAAARANLDRQMVSAQRELATRRATLDQLNHRSYS
jgi:F0F1-type ATP synthase epsilon subunit